LQSRLIQAPASAAVVEACERRRCEHCCGPPVLHGQPVCWHGQAVAFELQAGEVYSALQALRAIQAAGMQPNVVTYCGMISALSRRRRHRERQLGYRLWQELQGSPLRLDAAAYRTGPRRSVRTSRRALRSRVAADKAKSSLHGKSLMTLRSSDHRRDWRRALVKCSQGIASMVPL
jgi:hypothetical protein